MRDFSLKQQIVENSFTGNTKVGIYECAVADSFMKNHPEVPLAYKLTDGNIGMDENRILTVPLWMSMFL